MRNRGVACGVALGLCLVGLVNDARAEPLFHLSGHVAMADGLVPEGTRAKLQVDLNRNGELEKFETLSGTVGPGGAYELTYNLKAKDLDLDVIAFAVELLAEFNARGFDALLDEGPLPIILTVEREGYATVVKRISTMFDAPSLDVVLAPLRDVQCSGDTCLSPDGAVRLSGFPAGTGIARAYASAYDPSEDTARFPGFFADDSDNLLISSGFAEINLYDAEGESVHELPSPISARFEAKRSSWKTLPDLRSGSDRVELPMYSFDQSTGEWVPEADGELQFEDGSLVPEESLADIHAGNFDEQIFVAFETDHFSSFNCDAPVRERACIKGRLVGAEGDPLAGIQVSVSGESYTGAAGTVITGADGYFTSDVMKSEVPNEDVDRNGKRGEIFTARVTAQSATGTFVGTVFNTPQVRGSVQVNGQPICQPKSCKCMDLGDVVTEFEEPRLCEITVQATFSGKNIAGSDGPLEEGEAVAGAQVHGSVTGGQTTLSQSAVAELCGDGRCGQVLVDDSGAATIAVPIMGSAPNIKVSAGFSVTRGDTLHYYSAQATITGCARDESAIDAPVELELDHAALSDLGAFIETLGDGDIRSPLADLPNPKSPFACGCRVGSSKRDGAAPLGAWVLLMLGLATRRRWR
jgi:MYXO-CTERM domain-containing protein